MSGPKVSRARATVAAHEHPPRRGNSVGPDIQQFTRRASHTSGQAFVTPRVGGWVKNSVAEHLRTNMLTKHTFAQEHARIHVQIQRLYDKTFKHKITNVFNPPLVQ